MPIAFLNLSQPPLNLRRVLQLAFLHALRQIRQGPLHAAREATADGSFLFPSRRRAAQHVGFSAARQGDQLGFHFFPHLHPGALQKFAFHPLQLRAGRAHQVLPAPLAQRRQIRFAHDPAVKHPDPPRPSVLAFHHAHDRFQARHIRAVAAEGFVAQGKTFGVDDERDHHLLAVGPMVARVAPLQQRVLLGLAFHVGAGQVVKQHVELGAEQFAIAFLQMALQFRLVGQQPVQTTIQAGVVDLAFRNPQQIIQCRGGIPALLDAQLAAGRTQAVNGQQRRHSRPGYLSGFLIQQVFPEPVQFQPLPQFQTQATSSKLPHPAHPHPSYVRIVLRHLDVRRKQFQLPAFALLVEDRDHLQPVRLRRVVQFAQITQRALTRTVGRADGFDQRPVGVALAILVPMIRSQKHRGDSVTLSTPATRALVYTTSTSQNGRTEDKNLNQSRRAKIIKNRLTVTNLG